MIVEPNRLMSRLRTGIQRSFPFPQFSSGAKIITVGDSITQYGNFAASNSVENRGTSILHWAINDIPNFRHSIYYDATATSGAAPPLFRGANFGIAAESATNIAARTGPMTRTGAQVAVVLCGTNVGVTDTPVNVATASIQSILDDLTNAGMFVCLGTILPRQVENPATGINITTALMDRILAINDWIRTKRSLNVAIWDAWEDMRDPAYSVGDPLYGSPKSGMTRDGVHLTPRGAYTASRPLRTILKQTIASSNLYTDTWFPPNIGAASNIILDGIFSGTGGMTTGGATGVAATNWTVQNITAAGNVSVVASVVVNPTTGGQSQRIVFTSDGLGSSATNAESITLTPQGFRVSEELLANGDWCQLFFKVRTNASPVVGGLQCILRNQTTYIFGRGLYIADNNRALQPYPNEIFDGWIVSEPMIYNTANVFIPQLQIDVLRSVAGSLTVDVDAAILMKTESAAVTFPYIP